LISGRYNYLDNGVFKNKLGIQNQTILQEREADYATVRAYELAKTPLEGRFDLDHLQAIHRHLFGDVYAWAGELRDIDLTKGDSYFANHAHIVSAARSIFAKLAAEDYLTGLDEAGFSERAACYLGEINALHPFREGNGRAQREFINHLAYKNGFSIAWEKLCKRPALPPVILLDKPSSSAFLRRMINGFISTLETTYRGLAGQWPVAGRILPATRA